MTKLDILLKIVEAGYSGYSKSNNAISAEENGIFPASEVEKQLKLPSGFISWAKIKRSEWHHSGKYYKKVNYYSLDDVKEYINNNPSSISDYKASQSQDKTERKFDKIQVVDFIRVHGIFKPEFTILENVTVIFKKEYSDEWLKSNSNIDEFCTIIKSDNTKLRKKVKNIKFFEYQFERGLT